MRAGPLPRWAVAVAAVLAVAAMGACEVHTDVGIDVARDGSGEVRVAVGLDDEAVGLVGDLATQLRVDDLRATGWTVGDPVREGDGLTWVRAAKPFADPEAAGAVLEEISGPDGPFRDFAVRRDDGLVADEYSFAGTVDLTGGLEAFSDDELRAALGGETFGERLAALSDRIGDRLDEVFPVRVAVRLPGDESANAPVRTDDAAVWSPRLGERLELAASSRVVDARTIGLLGVAAAALAGLAGLAMRALRRRGRPA